MLRRGFSLFVALAVMMVITYTVGNYLSTSDIYFGLAASVVACSRVPRLVYGRGGQVGSPVARVHRRWSTSIRP